MMPNLRDYSIANSLCDQSNCQLPVLLDLEQLDFPGAEKIFSESVRYGGALTVEKTYPFG